MDNVIEDIKEAINKLASIPECKIPKDISREDTLYNKIVQPKLTMAGIDIIMPLNYQLIFELCTDNNPGYIQVLVKDFLMHIKNNFKDKKIPRGYIISSFDYYSMYAFEYPPILEEDSEYYHELWKAQKYQKIKNAENSDNKLDITFNHNRCDTVSYWREIL